MRYIMGRVTRLWTTVVVSCGLGAGLWVGLQNGAGYDPGTDATASAGLAAVLGAVGIAWAQIDDPSRRTRRNSGPDTGPLRGVTPNFADRVDEWGEVEALVRPAMKRGKMQRILVIHGMGGVGKTEFALHSIYKLIAELYEARGGKVEILAQQVDLNGYTGASPANPRDELLKLLTQLNGPDDNRAKMNLGDLEKEWRTYWQRKLLVLLLDNAADMDQVLPFIPGGSSYVILITSRSALRSLQARRRAKALPLGKLSDEGAMEMVQNILARPLPLGGEDREAIKSIVRDCDGLPAAIELAVTPLAGKPALSLATQAAQLAANPNQLLAHDEYAGRGSGGSGGVAQSFDFSYAKLSERDQLVLRRMALSPVLVLDVTVVTALTGLSRGEAAKSLTTLVDESLIKDNSTEGRNGLGVRYEMHDLIRRFAKSLAERDDPAANKEAVNRLLAYYWDAAAHADSLLTRQPTPDAIERPVPAVRQEFPDNASVISWTRTELPNLLACADYAVQQAENTDAREENAWVMLLAGAFAGILRNEGRWRRSIDLQAQAVTSAGKIGVPLGAANALSERGMLYRLTGELPSAVVDLDQAIATYRQVGGLAGQLGEAHALNTYGVVLDQLHRPDESRQRLSEALQIFRQASHPLGEANVLHDQGMAEFFAKNYDAAIQLIGQALELYRRVDQRLGMAHAYSNLARAQQRTGAERESVDSLEAARLLYQELGNQLGSINVQIRLGAALRQQDRRRAIEELGEAVELSATLGNQAARIAALDELGEVYLALGDGVTALEAWSRGLRLARDHGMEREEAMLTGKVRRVRPPSGFQSLVRWVKFHMRWKR